MAVGLGLLLGIWLRDARLVTMTGLNLAAYLFFLGGGFTTVAFLPDWIQAVSNSCRRATRSTGCARRCSIRTFSVSRATWRSWPAARRRRSWRRASRSAARGGGREPRALFVVVVALAALALAACTRGSDEPTDLGAAPSGTTTAPSGATAAGPTWRSELCHTAGDAGGTLRFSGECSFAVAGPALCRPDEDDFYILVKRTLDGGRAFNFYVNVERHHGPGEYAGNAQIHVTVRDGAALYRWSNFTGTLTLAGDTKKSGDDTRASFHGVRLDPEPGTPARGSIIVDGTIQCMQSSEPPRQ